MFLIGNPNKIACGLSLLLCGLFCFLLQRTTKAQTHHTNLKDKRGIGVIALVLLHDHRCVAALRKLQGRAACQSISPTDSAFIVQWKPKLHNEAWMYLMYSSDSKPLFVPSGLFGKKQQTLFLSAVVFLLQLWVGGSHSYIWCHMCCTMLSRVLTCSEWEYGILVGKYLFKVAGRVHLAAPFTSTDAPDSRSASNPHVWLQTPRTITWSQWKVGCCISLTTSIYCLYA